LPAPWDPAQVLGPYRDVLAVPGAPAFVVAGLVARLPISMLGIGIVLLVQSATGSYGLAGGVAATFGLLQALTAPLLARTVDRAGQARVMAPAIAVHVTGLVLLVVTAQARLPVWTTFAAAAVAGSTIGSVGALVRARWSHVLTDRPDRGARLHTAYSLESVLDEVVFVTGPPLVTLLAVRVSPAVGILVAVAAVTGGGTALLAQRGTEPPPSGARPAHGTGVMRAPGMVVLSVAFVCVGGIFGAVEVVTVAFTQERGVPQAAGWVLAAFAFGSLLAGIVYGAVQWTTSAGRRFVVAVVLLAVGVVPVLLVERVALLGAVVFLAGFAISPMLISGTALVQDLVVPTRLTEGLAWVGTALGLGVSVGSAISGSAVDAVGASRAFAVPVVAGGMAAVVVLVFAPLLRPSTS
jgi:predicted MFS family arabinose efflux permease